MFTGIVQGTALIKSIEKKELLWRIVVQFPQNALKNVTHGASIAINGTCLTVSEYTENTAAFDVMMETLRVTNLSLLTNGDAVNFERAAKFGDEIGGHLLSGHVHTTITISAIEKTETNCIIRFKVPAEWTKYILTKGFVAVNGCSLTVGEVANTEFNVYLIPETLDITTFGTATVGDIINLEVDHQTQTIVDTVERLGLKVDRG
ncbi:riboflavin synthase subunit alpha [Alkalimarinus sediminis]|uniref:Riboflavin synthase n=1 Tax=Alkalimarinus sediminis TaxID=1632866 RepID=A0A9E8KKT3_9ALTE|nr:riboflavin synthase subunit alpha [Alkalimarinus sediminis]UZW76536.1 riboflavin synthase subunit alpha [Alkalimarinus sediminis]